MTENNEPTDYTLTQGTNVLTFSDRDEAVQAAKKLSAESRARVSLNRNDGTVKMQFRDGSLETYALQTRRE